MATLDSLKLALRQKVAGTTSSPKQPLTDAQYNAGFETLSQGLEWTTYQNFIIPQLTLQLAGLLKSRTKLSVLEIGPGHKSVLAYLPSETRIRIARYTAFEPNDLFATSLNGWISGLPPGTHCPFPGLESPPDIRRVRFPPESSEERDIRTGYKFDEKYDLILFCHSLYGMKPKHKSIEEALKMLDERPGAVVVVFHCEGPLHLPGLVCHKTASFPTGLASVPDDDLAIDCFTQFIAGFCIQDVDANEAVLVQWREVCRALCRREKSHSGHILFSSPNVMVVFTRNTTAVRELATEVPLAKEGKVFKNREACLQHPTLVVRPTKIQQVQNCVWWALKNNVGLTVAGGGHSGHCLRSHVVSVDMEAFDQVHIVEINEQDGNAVATSCPGPLVVAGGGCKTGDIIHKTMAAGLTVPLGARPSVGAGQWLQGGIGHLTRSHGLACDSIIGAVIVSVDSGQLLYVGNVPSKYLPIDAVLAENESDLLWAIKGAGNNFGIVIQVTFQTFKAEQYLIRNWIFPLRDGSEAQLMLSKFNKIATGDLPRYLSADAYVYWEAGQLHLGVTMFESSTKYSLETNSPLYLSIGSILGPEHSVDFVDGVGLFDSEMYMSKMHGGHGGGKTSSFKRCLFLNNIGSTEVADSLLMAVETRPSSLCYLHLLHGGGAVCDIAAQDTAFGCRDWDFACVITGVWPRDQDGTESARGAVRWVYNVVDNLLPLSSGVYGADLGPDPRDAGLAAKAFGPNQQRLVRLKNMLDPCRVLKYAFPLPEAPREPKLIILVTGRSCAGKDYCAGIWVSVFKKARLTGRVVSISDVAKREYAAMSGADLSRLLTDRAYKEQHRPSLTAFFQSQVRQRPGLPKEHFQNVVSSNGDVDVLIITGIREEAAATVLSHLVPNSRVLDVCIIASEETRLFRGGKQGYNDDALKDDNGLELDYRPDHIFYHETSGNEEIKKIATKYLLPFFHKDLQKLADIVRTVADFPRRDIQFRHVLDISQRPGGLALSASLLQKHFLGIWSSISAVVACEAGGFIFASALASRVNVPLALIREAGKLPPPTVSVLKAPSHISAATPDLLNEKRIEMERNLVPRGSSVVVVDDVLASGKTLCAVLRLLGEAGINKHNISIMVIAEFPSHKGREFLRQNGFGTVATQSLLVYGGV
ncbi:hypothetical protein M426DRAFT_197696 [Hypoxylon sp. CI-4A]|nr:hypothetical protein M426DRAFT_197696 [Hypoxylon sp. CI-4A]